MRMKPRVFVAGATGAVGRPLVRQLIEAGWEVWGSTRSEARAQGLREAGAQALVLDVLDAAALRAALARVRPEVVLHQLTDLPARYQPQAMAAAIEANARLRREGTRHLVQAALAAGCRRMVAQSIAWAYAEGPQPHAEDDPLDAAATGPRGVTVQAVIALESQLLATPGLQGLVLRYGHLYGPGTWSERRGADMPLHVEDAARAAVLALAHPGLTGAIHISEPCAQLCTERARQQLGWAPRAGAVPA